MSLEFDPNQPAKTVKIPEYATYIPSRNPNFKMHKQINHARNALSQRAGGYGYAGSPGIMYQHIDGEWVEIDRFEPPDNCMHCGLKFNSTNETIRGVYGNQNISRPRKVPVKGLYAYKEPIVCAGCYYNHFQWHAPNKIDPGSIGTRLF